MKVYVIVVTYNGLKWIDTCLTSLQNSTIPLHVIVVDNASTDGTVQQIKNDFPQTELVENKTNLGFGRANNLGFRKAVNADYVFLLNQDARIKPDALSTLIAHAEKNKDYGLLSPVQLNGDGTALDQIFASSLMQGKFPWFYSDIFTKNNDLKDLYQVAYVPAAAWLLPINTIKTIGGFDPLFTHYGEDDNYMQRIKYFDLKIGICPNSLVYHDKKFESEDEIKARESTLEVFEKDLKVKYADVNCKRNLTKYWMNTFLQTCRYMITLKFKSFANNIKKSNIICHSFLEIKHSHKTNKQVGLHYLPQD